MKFCLPPPAPSFSMGSRMLSPAPILPTALSYWCSPRLPNGTAGRSTRFGGRSNSHARHIICALLDAAAHGLQMLPQVRLKRLPRMADFALWAAACEGAFRPAGTLETAYSNNRRAAIENIIDADPVAALVREIMADRAQWTGTASGSFAGRRQPVWLAKESPRTRWPAAPGTDVPPHTRD